jgi:hypothetical protein
MDITDKSFLDSIGEWINYLVVNSYLRGQIAAAEELSLHPFPLEGCPCYICFYQEGKKRALGALKEPEWKGLSSNSRK